MNQNSIIAALVTPFDRHQAIHYEALRGLVNHHIDKGIDGLYICGSTAECFLLSDEERMKIVETVVDEVRGRIPVIAQIGSIGSMRAGKLASHAAGCGVSAISSVTPFYFKFSIDEIARYYEDIAKVTDTPLIIYSIPAFAGVSLTADNIGTVLNACGATGLKYTSYDLFELERIHRRFPDLALYNGHDEVYLNALPIGIAGAIGSTMNIMPQKYARIYDAYSRGDIMAASQLQSQVNRIIDILIKTGVNQGIKYLMSKEGYECGDCRPPFKTLDENARAMLDEVYESVLA